MTDVDVRGKERAADSELVRVRAERAVRLLHRATGGATTSSALVFTAGDEADIERALGRIVLASSAALEQRRQRDPDLVGDTASVAYGTRSPLPSTGCPVVPSAESRVRPRRGDELYVIGPAVAVAPVVDPAELPRELRRQARAGLWVRNIGALCIVFLAYQWWGTGFEQHRAQAAMAQSFTHSATSRRAAADSPAVSDAPPGGATPSRPATPSPKAPAVALPGGVVARIQIPAIHVDQFVVEGTSDGDLRRGPGHYIGSPMPGNPGNAAIAGHRTTYGAPFSRLDDLKPGDTIVTTSAAGEFLYVVSGKQTVLPSQTNVVNDFGDNRLTLTTCTPKFSATHRLVVIARLQGPAPTETPVRTAPPPPPASAPKAPAPGPAARELQAAARRGFDVSVFPPVIMLAGALWCLALLYRPVRRRLPPLAAAVVLTPPWVCLLLMLFEQLNRFLPPNV